jgi:hypothetical protein
MYALDQNAAKKADQIGGSIKEIGKYIGTFTQAEDIEAASGTRGVALSFDSNGQKTRLSLYTVMKDGKKIMGFDALMAIMTCMNVGNIKPVAGKVRSWDYDNNVEVIKDGKVFPELVNKPIGVLLETEDYEDRNGAVKTRMALKGVFQAETEFTASEIIDKKTKPEQLPRMVAALRHHPLKGAKKPSGDSSSPAMAGFDYEDAPPGKMPWEE